MKAIITLLTLLWSVLAFSQSLDELYLMAAKNRPEIQAAYADFEAEVERVAAVTGFPNPNLSMGYFISPIETRVGPQLFRASLSQRIPWWGEIRSSENAQKAKAEVAFQKYIVALNELYIEVSEAYATYFEWENKYSNARIEKELRIQSLELKQQQYAQGNATLSAITRAEMALDDIIRITQQYEQQLDEVHALLSTVIPHITEMPKQLEINIPDSLPIELDTTSTPFTIVYDKKANVLDKQKSVIQKKRTPKLSVGLDYMVIGNSNLPASDAGRDAFMPMIGISLPIFNSNIVGELNALQKEKEALLLRKNEALIQSRLDRIEVASAFNNQLIDIAFFEKQIQKTDLLLELVTNEYKLGKASYSEVIELQQQRLRYSDALIHSRASAFRLWAQFRVLSGQLDVAKLDSPQWK